MGYPTESVKVSQDFFQKTLGLEVYNWSQEEDFAIFKLPWGQYFEVLGEGNTWHRYLKHPVIAFEVEDVSSARQELEEKGVKFVSENARDGGFEWAFFEGPDGYLFEIVTTPKKTC